MLPIPPIIHFTWWNCSTPAILREGSWAECHKRFCTSVSSRDSTKMCPYQAQITIFRVLTCLLLLGVRWVCALCAMWWVCGVCVCVVCWCVVRVLVGCLVVCGWCASLCVVECRCGVSHTLSRSRYTYTVLMCMSVSLFLIVFAWEEKAQSRTLTFPWCLLFEAVEPSKMVFMFFPLVAVSSTFLYFRKKKWSLKSRRCLQQLREEKNMKPLWKVQGFEKQTSWKVSVLDFVIHDKNEQQEWRRHVHVHLNENVDCTTWESQESKTRDNTTHHIQEGHGYSCRLPALVLNHFDIQSRTWLLLPRVSVSLKILTDIDIRSLALKSSRVNTIWDHRKQQKKRQRGVSSHVRTAVCS